MSYRIVYGETMPAWERMFPTRGDVVFSIKKIVPGERPQSMTALIESGAMSVIRS